ncbi:MAG: 50S ribosomal protein L13 [Anderseniella sp.]
MKTFSIRASDIEKKWILIDAEGLVVGRLAAVIATRLRGKHKPSFTPHMDMGDNVIVINADKVVLTGNKRTQKTYYRHTGYPGGIREAKADKLLEGRFPERVLQQAVKRMMPGGPLSRDQLSNLRIFAGTEHPHEAQQPEIVDVKGMNPKNSLRG